MDIVKAADYDYPFGDCEIESRGGSLKAIMQNMVMAARRQKAIGFHEISHIA